MLINARKVQIVCSRRAPEEFLGTSRKSQMTLKIAGLVHKFGHSYSTLEELGQLLTIKHYMELEIRIILWF